MKFLCDRCKTRYSIGDDRVRGKILKIRCKNCANVITVREGMMPDPDAAPEPGARPGKATTGPIEPLDERGAAGDRAAARDAGAASRAGASAAAPAASRGAGGREVAGGRDAGGGREPGGREAGGREAGGREPAGARGAGAARESAGARETAAGREAAVARDAAGPRGAGAAARGAGAARDPVAAALAKKTAEIDTVRGLGRSAGRAAGGAPRADSINNALNAAFASAMAQPAPAALEEEWYVSIDGEQAGPFSLAEAQRWVGQQAFDAELHCWSEGFDDWLPVDKVSHFRGLRKRPQAAIAPAPPPLPRTSASPRIAIAAPAPAPAEDEPKPLFAATMAALERGAPAIPTVGLGLPPTAAAPARTTPPLGTPIALAAGLASRAANGVPGAAGSPIQTRPGFAPDPRADARGDAGRQPGRDAKPGSAFDAGRDAKPGGTPGPRPGPASGAAPGAAPGAFGARPIGGPRARPQLLGDPFDPGDGEGGDLETQLEAMPFEDAADADARSARAARAAGAGRDGRPSSSDAAMTSPHLPASSTLPGTGANAAVTAAAAQGAAESASGSRTVDFGSDDDLDIGEVSRVVNLADVSRAPRGDRSNARRAGAAAPAEPARPMAGEPSLRSGIRPSGGGARPAAAARPAGDADPGRMMAPVVRAHRRGLIALLAVAALMVLGVIGAVLVFVARDDDVTGDSLGPVHDIDTSRPDDPITHHPVGSAAPVVPAPVAPTAPRPVPHPRSPSSGATGAESPGGPALAGDEIEDVARKHQETTQRCYMRSQRGADAILIGDVKKIAVTLTIDREGNVSDLQLSEHAADNLGRCLTGAIRAWKFRQSSGGTFRISLAFVSG